jgi:hypothetical protein
LASFLPPSTGEVLDAKCITAPCCSKAAQQLAEAVQTDGIKALGQVEEAFRALLFVAWQQSTDSILE